jgi:Galactokinase galactose-binding signature/GHMP kinases N terminal domain
VPIKQAFTEFYQQAPEGVWHAPGRVNLIGEHTDYNGGLVLPMALAQGVTLAAARRDDDLLELRSLQEPDSYVRVPIDRLAPGAVTGWAAYAAGPVWALRSAGRPIGGTSLLIDSDLPRGAGLSSSAAVECAVALAVCDLYAPTTDRSWLARLTQHAENDFVGVPCGILDQSASLLCIADHALLLDCRTGLSSHVPMNLAGLVLLVIDTRAVHELVDGEYGSRRDRSPAGSAVAGEGRPGCALAECSWANSVLVSDTGWVLINSLSLKMCKVWRWPRPSRSDLPCRGRARSGGRRRSCSRCPARSARTPPPPPPPRGTLPGTRPQAGQGDGSDRTGRPVSRPTAARLAPRASRSPTGR